ncbi:MAG: SMP-30/gluconolactonase/LRE family protein [Maricaulaceae bacterium]|nr:SMP-30/gluconolactonase/LRE family protein [Maricaulaceae bacterium]
MRVILIIVGVVVLAALVRLATVAIPGSGVLASHEPLLADQCRRLDVAPGAEDVTIDPETGVVFVSAAPRRAAQGSGGIYAFHVDDPEGTLALVSHGAPEDFMPHGISLWRGEGAGPAGGRRLFVINHPRAGGHTVEVFDALWDGFTLTHVETISYPELASPNDLAATGPRSFYASNDRRFPDGIMGTLEAYFGLPLASVSHFDGERGHIAARGLIYANGVTLSADGRTLYVAEIIGRRITVYDRDPETGALRRVRAIRVPTAPDNLELDENGHLWTGGHPRIFDFVAHAADESVPAPSQVVRIDPESGETETVLYDDGRILSASSVAAVRGGVMVVGAVFDGHVLICPRG